MSDYDGNIDIIRKELLFFKLVPVHEDLIKILNEMLNRKLIYIAFGGEPIHDQTWFGRTNEGTRMWKEFDWAKYEDFIDARNIELYGE